MSAIERFHCSGEIDKNILVTVCKGIVFEKKIYKGIFFMLFQGSTF